MSILESAGEWRERQVPLACAVAPVSFNIDRRQTVYATKGDKPMKITNGILEMIEGGDIRDGHITIPDGVTGIASGVFRDRTTLKSVAIPDSVASIGSGAFSNTAWYDAQPDGLVYAGKVAYAYKECKEKMPSNTHIALEPGTKGIADYAFYGCRGLIGIEIPDTVTHIGGNAFYNCTGLHRIVIPNGVTSLGWYAFYRCSGLTDVTIGYGVTSIRDSAFYACANLTSITVGGGVTGIGDSAFFACSRLESITMPNSVKRIGSNAFRECTALNEAIISSGVTSIGVSAFRDCIALPDIKIPDSVVEIGEYAFYNCVKLTHITIGSNVNDIGLFAFHNTGMWAATAKNDIVYADKWAVGYKWPLETAILAAGTVGIGVSVFSDCAELTSVSLPDSVTYIGNSAFSGCKGLTDIEIPDGVTRIGGGAFSGCSGLIHIAVAPGNNFFKSEGNCLLTKNGKTLVVGCRVSRVPDGVESIGAYAFYNCLELTDIKFPTGLVSVGYHAFQYCRGLVTPPNGVIKIGDNAFDGCYGLGRATMTLPARLERIGAYAFRHCMIMKTKKDKLGVDKDDAKRLKLLYKGTAAQWAAVEKGIDWNVNGPAEPKFGTSGE
jgi:hypothetical protein